MKKAIIVFLIITIIAALSLWGICARIDGYGKYITDVQNAPVSDCIFVLGAGVVNGQPTLALRDRLENAYDLYTAGKSERILVSGDHGRKNYDEVKAMKDYLANLGVPRDAIFQDHAGFNTYDSMYRAKVIFEVDTMLICTNNFHIRRSLYIARRLGIDARGYPTADSAWYNTKIQNVREALSKVKAFLDVEIFRRKPKFEGEAIPIMSSNAEATWD